MSNVASKKLSGFMICPTFRAIKPEAETGVTAGMFEYLHGYLPLGRGIANRPIEIGAVDIEKAEQLVKLYNYSLDSLFLDLSYDPTEIMHVSHIVPGAKMLLSRVFNAGGVCYAVEETSDFASHSYEFQGYIVKLMEPVSNESFAEVSYYFKFMPYALFIGGQEKHSVGFVYTDGRQISENSHHTISLQVTKADRYPGRDGSLCSNREAWEYRRAGLASANKIACPKADDCQSMIPGTTNEAGVKYCNYYAKSYKNFPCSARPLTSEQSSALTSLIGPIPCVDYAYTMTVDRFPRDNITLDILLGSKELQKKIVEYPQFQLAEFLGTMGGTIGLWFGASVVGIVQLCVIAFDALGSLSGFNRKRKVGSAK